MNIFFIILYIVSIISSFALSFFVLFNLRKSEINRTFFLFIISVSGWISTLFLYYIIDSSYWTLYIGRINFAMVVPLLYFLLRFTVIFPRENIKIPSFAVLIFGAASFFLFLITLLTPLVDAREIIIGSGERQTFYGSAYTLYIFYYIAVVFVSILTLSFKLSRAANNTERNQILYVLTGFSFALFFGFVSNIFLPLFNYFDFQQFGAIAGMVAVVFVAMAIMKYHLLEIRVILTELLVVLIGILLLVLPFLMPSPMLKLLTSTAFVLFCVFGYNLIMSVQEEGRLREEAEFAAMRERAMRREAEELAENLKNLNQAKTQFLLSTQHHLRSPLSVIQGYLSLISEGTYGKVPNIVRAKIDICLESAQKLINLINEMLDVANFQMNKGAADKQPTDLAALIGGIINDLMPVAQAKNIYLRFIKLSPEFPLAAVDSRGIREALYNIIDNAVKYTQTGGVTVLLAPVGDRLRLSVVDTGIGMSIYDRRHLFNRTFERGDKAKEVNVTGKGIGLYLSGQLIINNNGTIVAESPGPDKGSTFIVELPIVGNAPGS